MALHQKVNNETRISRMIDDLGITIPGLTEQKKENDQKKKNKEDEKKGK